MTDLINDLSKAYESLRDQKLSLNEAKEISNLAGKLIKSSSVQLKYNQYMKSNVPIPFLEGKKEN
jgi:hypothetical protein